MTTTAETITDEQIRELRDGNIHNGIWGIARIALGDAIVPFDNGEYSGYRRPSEAEQQRARNRLAAILEARRKEGK